MALLYRIRFDGDDVVNQRRYSMLHTAFIYGGTKARTIDVMRQEIALLDKIEAIGAPDESKEGTTGILGDKARVVMAGSVLDLTKPEHEILTRSVAAIEWSRSAVRDVVDLADWLEATEVVKP